MNTHVDIAAFQASLRRLARLSGKTQSEVFLGFARSTLTNRDHSGLLDITPPASQGVTGVAAKKQGERAIERDLYKIFAAVKLKHKRAEKHPDVEGIHRRLFQRKRPGSPLRSDLGRQKYYVDSKKLRVLMVKLKRRVGVLASAWLVSARRLGVRGPAWIERHGAGNGACRVQLTAPRYEVEMSMDAPEGSPINELERRAKYAVKYTEGRLNRAIEGTIVANAKKAGFKAAA